MEKILIIQTAFIGDVILATPVIEALHIEYPHAEISILVKAGCEDLFLNHPFLNEVIVFNKNQNKIANLFSLLAKIRRNKFDMVVNLHRFLSSGILTAFSKADVKIGFSKNPLSFLYTHSQTHHIGSLHETQRNLSLVSDYVKDICNVKIKLHPSIFDFKQTEKYKKSPYICIAPTSVWFTKQFPKKKWIFFIDQIDPSMTIYLLGSKADEQDCEKIKKFSSHANIKNLAGSLSLLESAALMKDAKMNYVNDSAPMHIASSVNAPVTAIFCSTATSFGFTPLSDLQYVIEADPSPSCKPCGLHGLKKCPKQHFNCANLITTEQLLAPLKIITPLKNVSTPEKTNLRISHAGGYIKQAFSK